MKSFFVIQHHITKLMLIVFMFTISFVLNAFSQLTADELFAEATALFKQKQMKEGAKKLDEVLAVNPEHQPALASKIYLNAMVFDDCEQVIKDLARAAKLNKNPASIYAEIGYLYTDKKKYDNALKLADTAIPLYPKAHNLYVIRGIANKHKNNLKKAIADYESALAIKPEYEYALDLLATAKFADKDVKGAMATIEKILNINPKSHVAYHTRSNFYADMGERQKALEDIQAAVAHARGDKKAEAYYTGVMALIYNDLGDMDNACDVALAAKKMGDGTAYMFIDHSSCQHKLKDIYLKVGSKLHYDVEYFGKSKFNVELAAFSPKKISFNWNMTIRPDMLGTLTMDEKALTSATAQHNYFEAGEKVTFSDKTSVWVSKKVFSELKAGKEVNINTGKRDRTFIATGKDIFEFEMNGITSVVNVIVAKSKEKYNPEDKSEELWILDNVENRLIVKMFLGWKIELKGVVLD